MVDIKPHEYAALAEFRYQIRRFLRFSEQAAKAKGLKPRQHQCLLALKALSLRQPVAISDLAEQLQLRHHSVVELLDRLVEKELIERTRGEKDRRQVCIRLTPTGEAVLHELSLHHREELRSAGPNLVRVLEALLRREPSLSTHDTQRTDPRI